MAYSNVAVSKVLCFLVNKFGCLSSTTLKSIAADFYHAADISAAKTTLLDDINGLNLDDKLPHIPRRRETTDRLQKELDDIIAMITFMDERKSVDLLPRYAVINPDDLPPVKLFDGDMKFILDKIDNLTKAVDKVSWSLAAMIKDVHSIYEIQQAVRSLLPSNVSSLLPASGGPTTTGCPADIGQTLCTNTTNNAGPSSTVHHTAGIGGGVNTSWAATNNVPITTTDDDDADFTLVRSKRRRSKRLRGSPYAPEADVHVNHVPSGDVEKRQRNGPLMIGKSTAAATTTTESLNSASTAIKAAKPIYKKAVFCIDNIDNAVTVQGMSDFIHSLNIEVLTISETKPRRRRNEGEVTDRKAFRVCIKQSDQDLLLNDEFWPAHVSIFEWFFKSAQTKTTQNKRAKPSTSPVADEQKQSDMEVAQQHDSLISNNVFLDCNDEQ